MHSAALGAAVAGDVNVSGSWQGHKSPQDGFDDEADGD